MTTTAQAAYEQHHNIEKEAWDAMTEEQQLQWLREDKTLAFAANEEADANSEEERATQHSAIIAEIQAHGYTGTGTLADYKKLMNRPEIFGSRWEINAQAAFDSAMGIESFISLYQQYGNL